MKGQATRHGTADTSEGGLFRLSLLALLAGGSVAAAPATADDRLDFSFIQGGAGVDAAAWEAINSNYIPGRYLLDVVLNDKKPVKQQLEITPEDRDALCLSQAWLTKAGIVIAPDYFKDVRDAERDCYVLSAAPSVTVDLDVASQTLTLALPQVALSDRPEDALWEYGNTALRVNYSTNVSVNEVDTTTYGSLDLKANLARWVVTSTASMTEDTADISMFTASRAIQSLQADLSLGRAFVGDSLLGSAPVYGASLASNNSMRANDLGYTPVFTGVAKSDARVTLIQSGSTIYSEPVPPGPFAIRNVTLLSSGDVEMVITERDGTETRQIFPVTVMSGMITPGEHEFTVAAGGRDTQDNEDGARGAMASLGYGYGLSNLTLRTGAILHHQYQGVSGTVTTSMGDIGGLSLSGAWARAEYDDGAREQGAKTQLTWNKTFTTTGTGIYATAARRLSEEFTDFSSFSPGREVECQEDFRSGSAWPCTSQQYRGRVSRNELSLGFSQSMNGLFTAGLTGWRRDYWGEQTTESGLTGTLSTQLQSVSLSLGGSLSETKDSRGETRDNWSASLSVSVPFSLLERRYSAFTTVTTGKEGGAGVTTGVSGSLNDRFSYSVGGGRDSDGNTQGNLSGSYTGDKAGVSMSMTQSGSDTTGSASVTGSVLALPAARSVILSRTVSDTVGVANIKDTPGVKFFSGMDTSDRNGNVVIPLTSYHYNTVTVDAGTLPHNVELGSTSQGVVPTEQAVVYLPFETWTVQRYLLQVRQKDGSFVRSGTWARDAQGAPLGFVAQNGVLLINAVSRPGDIRLGECLIPATILKESERVQEVKCE